MTSRGNKLPATGAERYIITLLEIFNGVRRPLHAQVEVADGVQQTDLFDERDILNCETRNANGLIFLTALHVRKNQVLVGSQLVGRLRNHVGEKTEFVRPNVISRDGQNQKNRYHHASQQLQARSIFLAARFY